MRKKELKKEEAKEADNKEERNGINLIAEELGNRSRKGL